MQPNIAFFDSGQGGLTVWESVVKKFPTLNTCYLGDNARAPYGNKGKDTITRYTSEALFHLIHKNAQLIVVACGTASSVAVESVKHVFRVPIVGIVDGLCAEAVEIAKPSQTIAVLGTRFTVASQSFERGLTAVGATRVWQNACPLFVPLVEEGILPGPMAIAAAELYLKDIPQDTGVVILGCTHYPRLTKSIADVLHSKLKRPIVWKSSDGEQVLCNGSGEPVTLIDSSWPIVRTVENFLKMQTDQTVFLGSERNIFCSDAPERFREVAKVFTSLELPTVELIRIGT